MNRSSTGLTYVCIKRAYDVVFSIIGLALLSPLMVIISILIKCESKGPIIYKGIRSGLNSTDFEIYKFRTMMNNAESFGGYVTAENDTRVTRVGKVLRKYKLDELPQLINVLTGTMSIVGPRPEVPLYTRRYTIQEQIILTVRPGITDYSSIFFVQLAGIVGPNDNERQFDENIENVLKTKNKLRIKYVEERSFKTDVRIIVMTFIKLCRSFR